MSYIKDNKWQKIYQEKLNQFLKKGIPEGLAKRWAKFYTGTKKAWAKVAKEGLKGAEAMKRYWQLRHQMAEAGNHLMSVAEAKKYGVEPHPTCVLAKMADGMSRGEARKQCIQEGKFHGISELAAEIRKEKLSPEQGMALVEGMKDAGAA